MAKEFDWAMYRYTPSLIGAIICIVIFSVLAGLHCWQWVKTKRSIIIWVLVGAILEVTGYAARIGSHYQESTWPPAASAWPPFIMQGVFLLVAPLFLAATVYMMLGRTIILAGGAEVSIIKPIWCTRLFVGADVATLVIQGNGAGIMGTMQLELALAGEKIVIAGLALQVATFIVFLIIAGDFHIRMNKKTQSTTAYGQSTEWRKMLWILYTLSSLILLRCVFRLIEYSMGNNSYLIAHEWTLYVFDTTPMFLVLVLMLVLQPSKYVPEGLPRKGSGSSEDVEVAVEPKQ
ncbi:RTA1 like protein [Amniculicola lignicola CBS 123094]|uniref:RTA1 like protein n=1 Tax=Amniculicola lignicola CBS 123094 TaxID=1392246 RepID=A0A6A5WR20_9PLEO|nr:RTA1 like protein [Amniculicola lignicola CBS 123094]